MEPVMERTRSALTDLEAIKFLVEEWPQKATWRPATPQDQERFDHLDHSEIKPLVALGEGGYGSVNLCRIVASSSHSATVAAAAAGGAEPDPASGAGGRDGQRLRRRSASAATVLRPQSAAADVPRTGSRSAASLPTPRRPRNASDTNVSTGASRRLLGEGSAFANGGRRSGGATDAGLPRPASPSVGADSANGGDGSGMLPEPPLAEAAEENVDEGSESGLLQLPSAPIDGDGDGGDDEPAADADDGEADDADGGSHSDGEDGEAEPTDADDGGADAGADGASAATREPQLIVAVKRVPLGWNQERELMQLHRCQQCPFIVRLFGFVEDGTEHCSYVMEWAEGGDLGAMLASLKDRRGANKQRLLMSEASARYYCACLLLALDYMHGHGLLHRDVKPGNLLLTSDGTAKLADLGFTVALDANGTTVGCCGTTGYIAPEVYAYGSAKGRHAYGVPADIWSAGATLYQILTGNVATDRHEEVLKKGWRPPSHPHFSKPLQDLLNRMLAPKPTSRPQSAASVMRHPWFAGFDWRALREGRMKAPYVPRERRRVRQPEGDAGAAPAGAALGRSSGGGGGSSSGSGSGRGSSGSGGPPTSSPGGQRLATVMERAPSLPGGGGGGGEGEREPAAVQRSALSGRGQSSLRRGREGMLRQGSSFETVLPTLPHAEAQAVCGPSGPGSAAGSGAGSGASSSAGSAAAGAAAGPASDGSSGSRARAHGHHGPTVRFAMGVAECA